MRKMIVVKALYHLPAIRHLILVVPCVSITRDCPKQSHLSSKQEIEHILLGKHHMPSKKSLKWTIKIVREDDFLSSLLAQQSRVKVCPNQSLRNPENMELLAINLVKTPESLSSNTPKILSRVSDEDIIEVFV